MPASAVLSDSRSLLHTVSTTDNNKPNSSVQLSIKPGSHLRFVSLHGFIGYFVCLHFSVHFSYSPSQDPLIPGTGLALQFGDVVQVTECAGRRYWRGVLVQEPTRECYIPSPEIVGNNYEVVVERRRNIVSVTI